MAQRDNDAIPLLPLRPTTADDVLLDVSADAALHDGTSAQQPEQQQSTSVQQQQPEEPQWNLSVKTVTGQTIPVQLGVTATTKVLAIKEKVEEQQGAPPSFQRLIFRGRELQDDQTIVSTGLQDQNVVHLVLRHNPPANGQQRLTPIRPEGDPRLGVMVNVNMAAVPLGGHPDPAAHARTLMEAWQLARAVKMFAVVDGVFLLIWAFQYWPLLLAVALACCGYYGAQHYRSGYISAYVLYLVLALGLRVWWMVDTSDNFALVAILVVGIIINLYIMHLTIKFLRIVRQLTPADKRELMAMGHPAMGGLMGN